MNETFCVTQTYLKSASNWKTRASLLQHKQRKEDISSCYCVQDWQEAGAVYARAAGEPSIWWCRFQSFFLLLVFTAHSLFFSDLLQGKQIRHSGADGPDSCRRTSLFQKEPVWGRRGLEPEHRLCHALKGWSLMMLGHIFIVKQMFWFLILSFEKKKKKTGCRWFKSGRGWPHQPVGQRRWTWEPLQLTLQTSSKSQFDPDCPEMYSLRFWFFFFSQICES